MSSSNKETQQERIKRIQNATRQQQINIVIKEQENKQRLQYEKATKLQAKQQAEQNEQNSASQKTARASPQASFFLSQAAAHAQRQAAAIAAKTAAKPEISESNKIRVKAAQDAAKDAAKIAANVAASEKAKQLPGMPLVLREKTGKPPVPPWTKTDPTYINFKKGTLTSSSAVQSGVSAPVVKPVVKPVAAPVAVPNAKPNIIPEHWMKGNPLRNKLWESLHAPGSNKPPPLSGAVNAKKATSAIPVTASSSIAQVASKAAPSIASNSAISAPVPSQDSKSQTLMQEWMKKNFNINESKIIRVTKDPTGIFHTDILVRGVDMQKDVIRHGESRLFHVELEGNTYHIRLINISSALPSGLMNVSSKSTSKLTDRSGIYHVIESLKRIATLINAIPKKNPNTGIFDKENIAKAKSILTSIKEELDIALPFAETIKSASNNTHNINKVMEDIAKFTALTDALEKLIQQSELAALEAKKSQYKAKMQASAAKIRGKTIT